jgi:plastocyanin
MSLRHRCFSLSLLALGLLVLGMSTRAAAGDAANHKPAARQIVVPGEDRFLPFAITIRVGQKVTWVNNDTENHYVVSNDAFNTAGHRGVNQVITGNGGKFSLTFKHAGVFPFYCSLHSALDADNQSKAPGPFGGIQDSNGNYGTPMSGVVTVVSGTD